MLPVRGHGLGSRPDNAKGLPFDDCGVSAPQRVVGSGLPTFEADWGFADSQAFDNGGVDVVPVLSPVMTGFRRHTSSGGESSAGAFRTFEFCHAPGTVSRSRTVALGDRAGSVNYAKNGSASTHYRS